MVERKTLNLVVVGSSPTVTTFSIAVGFCSVMVITLDFESSDPGSNPGRTFCRLWGWGGAVRSLGRSALAKTTIRLHGSVGRALGC